MADFFTRLAERTLGLANTIQPVLPSLFAPGVPLGDTELEAEPDPADETRATQPRLALHPESPSNADPRAEQPAARSQRPAMQPAQPHTFSQPDAQPESDSERVAQARPQLNLAPHANIKAAEPRAETPHLIEPSAAPPASRSRQPSEPAESMARLPDRAVLPPTANDSRSIAATPPVAETHASSGPRSLTTDERRDSAPPRSTTLPPATGEQLTLLPEQPDATTAARPELVTSERPTPQSASTSRSPEPPAAQPAPQIHVSIGRIEVRAVTPPPAPAPQPQPAPQPRISLDDYLRSRHGDRR